MEGMKTILNDKDISSNIEKITKVGHLYENIKFDDNDDNDDMEINSDSQREYLNMINNVRDKNYDILNKFLDNAFNADMEVLENKLGYNKDIIKENKKKFFFDVNKGKIVDDLKTYIRFIYAERIVFDILNIRLKDLEGQTMTEILKSKQQNRIDNFIDSIKNGQNNESGMDNNLKLNYAEQVKDRKNHLRYIIYFYYLKKSLINIEEEMKKLEEYCDTENQISKNNLLIGEKENELKNLDKDIKFLDKRIELRQEQINNPECLSINQYKLDQEIDQENREDKKTKKEKLEKELQRLKNVNFISNGYGNELKLAKNVLEDIQNSWKNVFESFIFHYMLEYPNTISQLREDYSFSMWEFVGFLLANIGHQNFNHALYEIDKTKKLKDFQGDEDKKRNSVLDKFKANINNLNENQRKFLNDLFHNKYDDGLENSWMRKAFWILFSGSSLFAVIAMAPLLAIIIPDVLMGVCALFASIIGVFLAICIVCSGANVGNEFGGIFEFLLGQYALDYI